MVLGWLGRFWEVLCSSDVVPWWLWVVLGCSGAGSRSSANFIIANHIFTPLKWVTKILHPAAAALPSVTFYNPL